METKKFDSMLDYALDYARRGFPVFPVATGWKSDGKPNKAPAWPGGATAGTTDPETLRAMFPESPRFNLGLSCSDVLAIDLDNGNGKDGLKTLADLSRSLGNLPDSPVSVTQTGGKHYLFHRPVGAEIKQRQGIGGGDTGLDIRIGAGGYIILPPSSYDNYGENDSYRWEIEPAQLEDLPELPPAWVKFFAWDSDKQKRFIEATDEQRADYLANGFPVEERTVQPALPKSAGEVLAGFGSNHNPDKNFSEYTREEQERAVDRARAYMERCPDCIAGRKGSSVFFTVGSILGHGLALLPTDRPIIEMLMNEYNHKCFDSDGSRYPWEGKEFEHKIDEMFGKPLNRPKQPRGFFFKNDERYSYPDDFNWDFTVNGVPNRPTGEAGKPAEIRFKSMLDYRQDIEARIGQPGKVLPTCFPGLNNALGGGIREGLSVFGAIPSLGKSTLAIQTADYWASIGKKVLFISLEMSKQAIAFKSFSRLTGARIIGADVDSMILDKQELKTDILTRALTYENIADRQQEGERLEALTDARQTYWEYIAPNLYVKERGIDDRKITADDVSRYAERFIEQTGNLDALFLDYLQILNGTEPKQSQKDKADEAVGILAGIANTYHIPVIAISSLNRLGYYKRLELDSFKESGGVEYGVDSLITVEPAGLAYGEDNKTIAENKIRIAEMRRADRRELELVVLKSRVGRAGGSAFLSFYPNCSMFADSGQEDKADGTAGNLPPSITESAGWNPKRTQKEIEEDIIEVIRGILINQTDSRVPLKTLLEDERLCGYSDRNIKKAIERAKPLLRREAVEDEQGNKTDCVILKTITEAELSEKESAKLAKKTAVKQARDLEADLFLSDLLAVKPMFLGDVATSANSAGFTNDEILGAFNRLGLKQIYRLEDNQTAEYWASSNDDSLQSNIPPGWKGGRKYPDWQDLKRNLD